MVKMFNILSIFSSFCSLLLVTLPLPVHSLQYLCTSSGVDYYTNPYPIEWVKTDQSETNFKCHPYSTYYFAKCYNDINNYTIQDFRMNNITYLFYHAKRKFYHLSRKNRLKHISFPDTNIPGQYRTQIYHPIVEFNVLCIGTNVNNKPKRRKRFIRHARENYDLYKDEDQQNQNYDDHEHHKEMSDHQYHDRDREDEDEMEFE